MGTHRTFETAARAPRLLPRNPRKPLGHPIATENTLQNLRGACCRRWVHRQRHVSSSVPPLLSATASGGPQRVASIKDNAVERGNFMITQHGCTAGGGGEPTTSAAGVGKPADEVRVGDETAAISDVVLVRGAECAADSWRK